MDIETIRYFLTVADCGNFTEAAERNHISQSSFSKGIMRLEKELGQALLDRSHHHVTLTPAGECFYREFSALKPLYEQAMEQVNQSMSVEELRVLICPRSYVYRDALKAFMESNRSLKLTLGQTSDVAEIGGLMLSGKYDMAITPKPLMLPPQLRAEKLYDDTTYLVASAESRFAGMKQATLAQLAGETFYESPYSWYMLRELREYFDIRPGRLLPPGEEDVRARTLLRTEAMHYIAANRGIGIYNGRDTTAFDSQNLVFIELPELPKRPTVLLERVGAPDSPGRRIFRGWLRDHLESAVYPQIKR